MKLFLFQLGLLQPLGIPVPGYLIQTGNGHNVLIDSGMLSSFITHPPDELVALKWWPQMHEEDFIISRLASVGLTPDDVDILVCTHFDPDHAGNHALFGRAELVVQRAHYEAARDGHARSQRARQQWDAPHLRYRLVDGDTTLLPGIEVIETGGHVPGHQSVLVRLPQTGPVLLTIDAVPHSSMTEARTRVVMPGDEDELQTRESTRKLAEVVAREGVTLSIYGHDAQQWPTLKKAPEFYE